LPWTVEISNTARKQLRRLDPQISNRIIDFLEERVTSLEDPRALGGSLNGDFQGLWKYRVGDYRIICEIQDHQLLILVVEVGPRREVYR
jgi:mRNA interferase RelE/StbE